MYKPDRAFSTFKYIRQKAGQNALMLARRLEKSTFKLEAHHRHQHFSHQALENQWFPKSLRFKPPGRQPTFKRIIERASNHCLKARISICHSNIKETRKHIDDMKKDLAALIDSTTFAALHKFLRNCASSVHRTITDRHGKKLDNLRS